MAPGRLRTETAPTDCSAQLTEEQLARLVRFTRGELNRRYALPAGGSPEPSALPEFTFDKINVTIRSGGRLRASMSGRGPGLAKAVISAVKKCSGDARFGAPLTAQEIPATVIELWIQVGAEPLDVSDPDALSKGLILGVHGIEIRLKGNYAYYKPSVPITSDLAGPVVVLEKLCAKAGLDANAWRQPEVSVRRTNWLHAVESPQSAAGCRILLRLRRTEPPSLNQASVAEAARAAANRLVLGQDLDGRFLYRYDPLKDQSAAGQFSSVRHAGCAYAVAWMGAHLGESDGGEFSWSAARALRFLLLRLRSLPEDQTATYVSEGATSQGKLGTSALTLLALQFKPLDSLFEDHRRGLRRALLALQNEAGWFEPSISRTSPKENNQDYYPGEALVALGHELQRDAPEDVSAAFQRAFDYYRDHFRRRPSTAFVLWQVDAWRLFDEHSTLPGVPSPYASFVFEMVDWLLNFQYTADNAPSPEYIGGFPHPGTPRYSTAVYTEAVIRACGLALRHGLHDRAASYRQAARRGLSFVRRLQIGPESAFLFPRPELAVGGISANLCTFSIRSDFDQHAITAFLAAIEVSRNWPSHAILDQ